ncbi:hypothetical protein PHSY_001684 [Pseudozyma hubeiensis SY62]|uniref:Transmembrane protein n=1 Tax=Pseudozyma hubeiensis (strain SY62) TaxID=1305764 RepID=R9P7M0_PSEHS|nr:hypothetical protein PHSY_001684 [Pseudozyma hubeiensis SY62]GAC94115.1 hypothetical protein PHSY_001684 [Pseudozyma hubeiensis SY62]
MRCEIEVGVDRTNGRLVRRLKLAAAHSTGKGGNAAEQQGEQLADRLYSFRAPFAAFQNILVEIHLSRPVRRRESKCGFDNFYLHRRRALMFSCFFCICFVLHFCRALACCFGSRVRTLREGRGKALEQFPSLSSLVILYCPLVVRRNRNFALPLRGCCCCCCRC